MKAWIRHRGEVLGYIALVSAIAAAAALVLAGVPYPPTNPGRPALAASAVLGFIGLVVGVPVWVVRAPGFHRAKAAVLIVGVALAIVGALLAFVFLIAATQPRMGSG